MPVCVAHVNSNMSVARPAKEIAVDIAANVASGTETGAGKPHVVAQCRLHGSALPEPFGSATLFVNPRCTPAYRYVPTTLSAGLEMHDQTDS